MRLREKAHERLDAHLLIVDDDERIRGLLRKFLMRHGFLVCGARCGTCAADPVGAGFRSDRDGRDDARRRWHRADAVAARDIATPILLLTAKGETEDRIDGLEAGADDYLAKPFEPKELLLRINAILRRMPEPQPRRSAPRCCSWGRSAMISSAGAVAGRRAGAPDRDRDAADADFLGSLGEPLSRAKLVEELGRDRGQAQERAVDVQITRLRRKIETDPKQPRYLQTVRGAGYMLAPD